MCHLVNITVPSNFNEFIDSITFILHHQWTNLVSRLIAFSLSPRLANSS